MTPVASAGDFLFRDINNNLSDDATEYETFYPNFPSVQAGHHLFPPVGGAARRFSGSLCDRVVLPARMLALFLAAKDSKVREGAETAPNRRFGFQQRGDLWRALD